MQQQDLIVVGAGMVGAAVAYGTARQGLKVLALDGDDGDFRAARANFGLVWQQGKGPNMPAYQRATARSVDLWPAFNADLSGSTGLDLQYERNGGLIFCLDEGAFQARRDHLHRLHNQRGEGAPDFEMLDRSGLEKLLPRVELGSDVVGASFGRNDGHANPLRLLSALHRGIAKHGSEVRNGHPVSRIAPGRDGFVVEAGGERFAAPRIVIAAGLGSADLARQVGLDVPIRPQRGQLLVTERLASFLPIPAGGIRQTAEGTVMIGVTNEEVGYDTRTTTEAAAWMSTRAIRTLPALANATLVRQWAGLRIMSPDSYPIYAESQTCPGAFVALCHSGVTLAAFHAATLAEAIVAGGLPAEFDPFHHRRFDVPKAA